VRKADSPYAKLLGMMRSEGGYSNPPSIIIGTVVSDNPLIVDVGDLEVDKDNLYVADYLLKEHKREFKTDQMEITAQTVSGGGSHTHSYPDGTITGGAHTHNINELTVTKGEIEYTDTLKKGDEVAVMPTADLQTYIILCRVVRLP